MKDIHSCLRYVQLFIFRTVLLVDIDQFHHFVYNFSLTLNVHIQIVFKFQYISVHFNKTNIELNTNIFLGRTSVSSKMYRHVIVMECVHA